MKIIKYIMYVCTALFIVGCAEDKGNYDYTPINDVKISGVSARYSIVMGDELSIVPVIERNLNATEENLVYSWEAVGKQVSDTRDLNYAIPNSLGFGLKTFRYVIEDKNTGMKYFRSFEVEVLNPYNWGYYFLTKKADNSTELGFLPVANKERGFSYANGVGSYPFGDEPVFISGSGSNVSIDGVTTYCFKINIMTKKGEYPIISTETATFYPSSAISEALFFDKEAGYTFSPYATVQIRSSQVNHYISNGQIIAFNKGFLYYPAQHVGGPYYWDKPIQCFSGINLIYVYDTNSKKYYVAKPDITDANAGIYTDAFRLNRIVPITNFPSLNGHIIIATDPGPGAAYNKPNLITVNNGIINMIEFGYYAGAAFGTPNFEKGELLSHTTVALSGANEKTKGVGAVNDWFITVGNKIYIAPKTNIAELRLFATIPSEYGEITSIQLSVNKTKLVVATYNSASTGSRKGGVIFVDASSGEILDGYKNVIHECVSILSANYYYIYGVSE